MNSFWIVGGFLLLTVFELEASTSVSRSSCLKRNLTVTVDDDLWLYIDGVEKTDLPYADVAYDPDFVDLPCTTRLIAIHGRNGPSGRGGILASTDDEYILTNSTWKCSNVSQSGWEGIDFDDSNWVPAVGFGKNGQNNWILVSEISANSIWIWLTQYSDMEIFCRKSLDPDHCALSNPCLFGSTCIDDPNGEYHCICAPGYTGQNCSTDIFDPCDPNPCLNSGICNDLGTGSFTCTCPIYATGVTCESANYNEAYSCGTTLTWSQYDAVNDFTRLCYFWTHVDDTAGRFTTCRNTINGLPLFGNYTGLLNAGGNFGCVVSQRFPEDISATSYVSCSDNFQQDVYLGNVSETDRLMVCIRYPYEGIPGGKQH